MRAPDKVYLAEKRVGFGDIYDMMWTEHKRSDPHITNVEYIRKDTLVEWLNEFKKYNPEVAIECVISKLESL